MKKLFTLFSLMLVAIGLLVGCSDESTQPKEDAKVQSNETQEKSQAEPQTEQVAIQVMNGETVVTEKEVELTDGSLYDLMKANFDVKDDNGFITDIEGVSQVPDKNLYWVFEINGEQVTKGAKEVTLQADDKVVWKLHDFS